MEWTHDYVEFLAPRLVACLGDPDGELERSVGTWIAYTVQFAPRYEVEYVDVGYDCSARVEPTNEALSDEPLTTVEDFLEQPNGHTVATYQPGAGLAAGSYSDDLSEHVSNGVHALVLKLIAGAPDPLRAAFEDADWGYGDVVDCDVVADAIIAWECALAAQPIAPILTRFEFAARRRRQLEEAEEAEARERHDARRALAAPLVALLRASAPRRVDAASQQVLWAACRKIARVAETKAQWEAFVEEVPTNFSLSHSVARRLPEMAEAIWPRIRSPSS